MLKISLYLKSDELSMYEQLLKFQLYLVIISIN